MKELLQFVTVLSGRRSLKVRIETLEGQRAMILQIYVAPDDMGKVIGRNGRVAKALRELIRAAAMREGKTAIVEIIQ